MKKLDPKADKCPLMRCLRDPCQTATCEMSPGAVCKTDKCSCTATFWHGTTEVTDACSRPSILVGSGSSFITGDRISGSTIKKQPKHLLPSNNPVQSQPCTTSFCFLPPCMMSNGCARYPTATCRNNYCNGCTARYYVGQSEVTSTCNAAQQQFLSTNQGQGQGFARTN